MKKIIKNINKNLKYLIKFLCLMLISFYQACISPMFPGCCRFRPTCSQYAKESFEKFGVCIGFILTLKRLGRCHPFGKSGYDPVPDKFCLGKKVYISK